MQYTEFPAVLFSVDEAYLQSAYTIWLTINAYMQKYIYCLKQDGFFFCGFVWLKVRIDRCIFANIETCAKQLRGPDIRPQTATSRKTGRQTADTIFQQIFARTSTIKFHENLFNSSRVTR
jgi:hypothetical protein